MKKLNVFDCNREDRARPFQTAQGHRIDGLFDLHCSGGANVFGYSHPDLIEAIQANLRSATSSFWKLRHDIWDRLGSTLDDISDHRYTSYLPALTGSDAVDHALRIIWEYHGGQRHTVLVRRHSYHSGSIAGWQMTDAALSAHWPRIRFVEFFDDLESSIARTGVENIAAVLIDTVPWVSGLRQDDHAYWQQFNKTLRENGLLLCVDEVLTGMGRMGSWLHSHQLGLEPNLVVLGKALTGGHENLALVLMDDTVTEQIKDTWLAMGNTRSTNTMGAVVAHAVITKMQRDRTLDHVNKQIMPYIRNLERLFSSHGYSASSAGTMLQVNMPDICKYEQVLRERGIYHQWDHFWHLSFYDISSEEMDYITQTLEETL